MHALGLGACCLLSFAACLHPCGEAQCSGSISLPLVTEAGEPASVRGELVLDGVPRAFDCSPTRAPNDDTLPCPGGVIGWPSAPPGPMHIELRYRRVDGSFTDWQASDLALETETDPDFNGPDCPCTWYTATAEPRIVPADALVPAGS
jgi:hypothetical protein